MAILNYAKEGTYSVIDNIRLNRETKSAYFMLKVYADAEKSYELFEHPFNLDGQILVEVDSIVNEVPGQYDASDPESYKNVPVFLLEQPGTNQEVHTLEVSSDSTEPVYPEGTVFDSSQEPPEPSGFVWKWQHFIADANKVYRTKDGKYWRIVDSGGKLFEFERPFLTEDFDTYFSIEAMDKEGANFVKNLYLWLKTQEPFSSLPDA